jgi:hypothetical protein
MTTKTTNDFTAAFPRAVGCRAGRAVSGNGSGDGQQLDGAIQEPSAGSTVVTGRDLRADAFRIASIEQGPGNGRRLREPMSSVASRLGAREHVVGKEPAEAGLMNVPDEGSRDVVIARPTVLVQANQSPRRRSGKNLAPSIVFGI